jgi:hypothetical protein
MSNLVVELLLRLIKPAVAAVLAGLLYLAALAFGIDGSFELLLLCWLSAATFILLVQESLL